MIEVLVRGRVRDFRIGLGLGLGFRLTLVFFVVGAIVAGANDVHSGVRGGQGRGY